MIKTLSKVEIEGTFLNIIKTPYADPQPISYLLDKKTNVFLNIGNKTGCLLLPLLFNIVVEVLDTTIRQEEEIKGIQIRKKKVKLSLFTENIILYGENPKIPPKKTTGTDK